MTEQWRLRVADALDDFAKRHPWVEKITVLHALFFGLGLYIVVLASVGIWIDIYGEAALQRKACRDNGGVPVRVAKSYDVICVDPKAVR